MNRFVALVTAGVFLWEIACDPSFVPGIHGLGMSFNGLSLDGLHVPSHFGGKTSDVKWMGSKLRSLTYILPETKVAHENQTSWKIQISILRFRSIFSMSSAIRECIV